MIANYVNSYFVLTKNSIRVCQTKMTDREQLLPVPTIIHEDQPRPVVDQIDTVQRKPVPDHIDREQLQHVPDQINRSRKPPACSRSN